MTEAPEPKDKLDATTIVVVNGPEDATLDWHAIDWRRVRGRSTAAAAADLHGVKGGGPRKGPQPTEVDAPLARQHAVERAAGDGAQRWSHDGRRGRRGGAHPGGQGELGRQGAARSRAVQGAAGQAGVHPQAGQQHKRRPLGIPVILDRCHQARVVNALEPEWEARFEPRSYGFRPGRGCHDAIDAIHRTSCGASTKRRWVLDADLAAAFDQHRPRSHPGHARHVPRNGE